MSNIDKINVNGTEYGVEGVAGDSKDDTTTFTSSDVADGSANAWTSVNVLASGEKHSSIFAKVSQMFKNVRYLYKLLGTTDFSGLGSNVSGAIDNLGDIIVKGVETTSTASQAYAVNEYMIYNKKLYKVKAAIASGATITVGTNIESANTNVGNELTSLSSSLTFQLIDDDISNSLSTSTSYIKLYANGSEVKLIFYIILVDTIGVNSFAVVGRVPTEYRPTLYKQFAVITAAGGTAYASCLELDAETGNLTVYNNSGSVSKLYLSAEVTYSL